jgi:nitrite reductase/ring-hydroxylating ferredoxin subunit
MPLVKVASLADVPPGKVFEAIAGDNSYALCNRNGEILALDGICPHAGGPLGQGVLDGDFLECPWHAWRYDCRTGVNPDDDQVSVQTYPVKIEDGAIFLELP